MRVRIESLPERDGIAVVDAVERRRYEVPSDGPVTPRRVDDPDFPFPVDAAARVETTELRLPQVPAAYLRDGSFEPVAGIEHHSSHDLRAGRHVVEVDAPMKLYIAVEGPATVTADAAFITVSASEPTAFTLGARSYHERPAATMTTTGDPRDVLATLSYFGDALKTLSPERAWPTLRGHPPALDVGERRQVPDGLARPEAGVTVEVPATLSHAFVAAPLAYYLGAELSVGDVPRIRTGDRTYPLAAPDGFEPEVERVLKRSFLLDCATRMDGLYDYPTHERRALERAIDVDFPALYDAPPADRLAAYLDVPHEAVAPYVPRWKLTAHVDPRPDNLEILPFLVDDLAVIRTPDGSGTVEDPAATAQLDAIREFTRARCDGTGTTADSRGSGTGRGPDRPGVVTPERTDSIEQAWVGDHVPVGASKAMVEAFRNRLDREVSEGPIEVVVVCNGTEMADEGATAREVYGSRDRLPFDVTFYEDLTTDRLRLVLESEADLLHYVGHIDDDGFQCPDGWLDAATLDAVGHDAFFLNACASYGQGARLIERGAVGGVVTLDEVLNSGAVRVGEAMTRLLNHGFPLRPALNIARERSIVGNQYIVIGDGNADVTHSESFTPNFVEVTSRSDSYEARIRTYPIRNRGMGTTFRPEIADNTQYYLVGTERMQFDVTADELREFLDLQVVPVLVDGEFTWSDGFDPS